MVEASPGPPLHVLATYPADGQGTGCPPDSAPDCGVPINTTIELRLDRFLDPSTAVRQAIKVYTGDGDANRFVDLEPQYDVVSRVLVYRLREPVRFEPRTLYSVEILQATEQAADGLRAFDQAALRPDRVPLTFSFLTGEIEAAPLDTPELRGCQAMVDRFIAAGCAGCHTEEESNQRAGLNLYSQKGLVLTAIGQVAHQTDLGPTSGIVLSDPSRVGINMARIAPGAPESSYLLYKLLRDPRNLRESLDSDDFCAPDSEPVHNVDLPEGSCFAPSSEELERLREWFVRGEAMPLPRHIEASEQERPGFTRGQLRELAAWIQASAPCPDPAEPMP